MADEVLDSTAMVRQLFGEGQGVPDEAGDALPQRVREALDVMGVPGVLREGFGLRRRHDPCGDDILSGIERRSLAIHRRQMGPPLLRARVTAIPAVDRHEVPRLLVHGAPPPWLGGLLLHDTPHLLRFHLPTPKEPLPWGRHGPHRQMSRQRRTAGDPQTHEPPDTDATGTAKAMQRDWLAASTFHQGALFVTDSPVVRGEDTLATTRLPLMVLRPWMPRPMFLESLGTTC
jgi:hypothetical protein